MKISRRQLVVAAKNLRTLKIEAAKKQFTEYMEILESGDKFAIRQLKKDDQLMEIAKTIDETLVVERDTNSRIRIANILKKMRKGLYIFSVYDIHKTDNTLKIPTIRHFIRLLINDKVLYTHAPARGRGQITLFAFTQHKNNKALREYQTAADFEINE